MHMRVFICRWSVTATHASINGPLLAQDTRKTSVGIFHEIDVKVQLYVSRFKAAKRVDFTTLLMDTNTYRCFGMVNVCCKHLHVSCSIMNENLP